MFLLAVEAVEAVCLREWLTVKQAMKRGFWWIDWDSYSWAVGQYWIVLARISKRHHLQTYIYIYIVYLDILIIYNIIYLFIYSVYNIYICQLGQKNNLQQYKHKHIDIDACKVFQLILWTVTAIFRPSERKEDPGWSQCCFWFEPIMWSKPRDFTMTNAFALV